MKIKTITCHEVYNHGASLQEYALLKFLNDCGHQAEAIHYKPSYLSGHFKIWSVNPEYNKPIIKQAYLLAKLPSRLLDLRRKRAFDKFHKRYIPTGKKRYESNDELKNDFPEADAFICGSDQIWNSYFENGKDPAFYLDFVPDNKLKISYAASFAIDKLSECIKDFSKEKISRLNAVSVRETSGLKILDDLGVKNAVQVLDPVFLLPKEHWYLFAHEIKDKYIFVYDFDDNPLVKRIALEIKKEKRCKIFTVNKNINYADSNFYSQGPEFYLSLMLHANFVITNSFHSVAFSLIFEKEFIVVNREDKINTRMRDILNLFKAPNLINNYEDFEELRESNNMNIRKPLEIKCNQSKQFIYENLNQSEK